MTENYALAKTGSYFWPDAGKGPEIVLREVGKSKFDHRREVEIKLWLKEEETRPPGNKPHQNKCQGYRHVVQQVNRPNLLFIGIQ